jgi:hypothetical protein
MYPRSQSDFEILLASPEVPDPADLFPNPPLHAGCEPPSGAPTATGTTFLQYSADISSRLSEGITSVRPMAAVEASSATLIMREETH